MQEIAVLIGTSLHLPAAATHFQVSYSRKESDQVPAKICVPPAKVI